MGLAAQVSPRMRFAGCDPSGVTRPIARTASPSWSVKLGLIVVSCWPMCSGSMPSTDSPGAVGIWRPSPQPRKSAKDRAEPSPLVRGVSAVLGPFAVGVPQAVALVGSDRVEVGPGRGEHGQRQPGAVRVDELDPVLVPAGAVGSRAALLELPVRVAVQRFSLSGTTQTMASGVRWPTGSA